VAGDAELAHEEDVERGIERACDLGRDGHAAAGETQHDHVVAAGEPAQAGRDEPARFGTIAEAPHLHHHPFRLASRLERAALVGIAPSPTVGAACRQASP
jgi:hypothetical protein